VTSNGLATATIAVTNNTVRQWRGDHGIYIVQKEGNGTLNATVTGNNISTPDPTGFALNGIRVQSGATASDQGDVNIELSGNTVADPPLGSAIRLFNRFDTDMLIQGYTGGQKDTTAVAAYVDGQNPASATVTAAVTANVGHGFGNVSSVADPAAPITPPPT
jgi:hypothetical protein